MSVWTDFLDKEDSDSLFLETGDRIVLEQSASASTSTIGASFGRTITISRGGERITYRIGHGR